MNKYDDIINLEHYTSKFRSRMPMENRAAQFAPFSALTGYEDAIKEKGRITKEKQEISEDTQNIISEKLNYLYDNYNNHPQVKITYFVKDIYKEGGNYITIEGNILKFDLINRKIILNDNTKINIEDIKEIDSNIFNI